MSNKEQLLYAFLHGIAMRYAAENRDLATSIAELRKIADGHNEVLAHAAGITAGSWYASPATHVDYELIGAGMLIKAGTAPANRSTTTSLSGGVVSASNGDGVSAWGALRSLASQSIGLCQDLDHFDLGCEPMSYEVSQFI
jgi:hypothetical protein